MSRFTHYITVQSLKKLPSSLRGALVFVIGRRSNLKSEIASARCASQPSGLLRPVPHASLGYRARNDESRRTSYNTELLPHSSFFKAVAVALITSFVALDISWAYPPESGARSALAVPSALQPEPVNDHAVRFQQSIFAEGRVLASVCSIARYLLDERLPIRHLEAVMTAELGDALQNIGLSRVTVTEYGAVLIPYEAAGKKSIIQIALKGSRAVEELIGYDWLVSDKYVVKELPEDYHVRESQTAQEASATLAVAETKEEPKVSISTPIAEVTNTIIAQSEQSASAQTRIFSIKAILKEHALKIIAGLSQLGLGASGPDLFSYVKEIALINPVLTGTAVAIAAILLVWRLLFPANWHMFWLKYAAYIGNDYDVSALVHIGAPAVPSLIKALSNKECNISSSAVEALSRMGPVTPEVVPSLIQTLNANDSAIRSRAAIALGKMGPVTPEVVPSLVLALKDRGDFVRRDAAIALCAIGSLSPEVIMSIIEALSYGYSADRSRNVEIIVSIGDAAVRPLLEALSADDVRVRSIAAEAINKNAFVTSEAIPFLLKALGEKDEDVRTHAALTLGRLGPKTGSAIRYLVKALNDDSLKVRSAAAVTLGRIGSGTEVIISSLISALRELKDEDGYRSRVLRDDIEAALVNMGAPAIPFLITALSDSEPNVRSRAAFALGKIGSLTPEVVPSLMITLNDSTGNVRHAVACALGAIGSSASEAIPFLVRALTDEYSHARRAAAHALSKLGWVSTDVKSHEVYLVAKEEWNDLVRVGLAAVPYLITALSDDSVFIRHKAMDALYKIKWKPGDDVESKIAYVMIKQGWADLVESGPISLSHLVKRLSHDVAAVRRRAAEVLDKIKWKPSDAESNIAYLLAKERWIDLLHIGVPAIPFLVRALSDKCDSIGSNAKGILVTIGTPAIPFLIWALSDGNVRTRFNAAAALCNIKDPRLLFMENYVSAMANEDGGYGELLSSEDISFILSCLDRGETITARYIPYEVHYVEYEETDLDGYPSGHMRTTPVIDRRARLIISRNKITAVAKELKNVADSIIREIADRKELTPADLFSLAQSKVPESMQNLRNALAGLKPLAEKSDVSADEIAAAVNDAERKYSLSKDEAKILELALLGPGQGGGMVEALPKDDAVPAKTEGDLNRRAADLFEMVETTLNNRKADFIKSGNIDQLEADGIVASLIILARRARWEGQKLIIGLETDWIPGMDNKTSLQNQAISPLVKEMDGNEEDGIDGIVKTLRSMGLDNVEIVHRNSRELAGELIRRADKTKTRLGNIVVLASTGTIYSDSNGFKELRDAEEDNKPLLAGIDPKELIEHYARYGEDTNNQLHINLTRLLYMTLEMAIGKEPPQDPMIISYDRKNRIVIFLPKVEPKDYESLKETYAAERTALSAA